MKKLLLILVMLMAVCSYAQEPLWWGYFTEADASKIDGLGTGARDIADGVKNSVNPVIQAGEEQMFKYKANINAITNALIQDKTKVKVVALLIDRSSSLIVNAAQTVVSDYDPTSMERLNAVTSEGEGVIYDLNGRKLSAPQKGINIIRMSDGMSRKVLVK